MHREDLGSFADRSIPGPIEFSDDVLYANATPGTSHVSPAFIPVFGDCLRMLRTVLYAESRADNQPFLVAGSGTLGWDAVGANLVERGDEVLVLNTGYFGDSFADCLAAYGAEVKQVKAAVGGVPGDAEIVEALKRKPKVVTITHGASLLFPLPNHQSHFCSPLLSRADP